MDVTQNTITNAIWHGQKIVPPYVDVGGYPGLGFNGWLVELPPIPDLPILGLQLVLEGGSGVIGDTLVEIPAIDDTLLPGMIYDYWINPDGTFTIENEPLNNYPALPHYKDKLHVWKISVDSTNIISVILMGTTYPTVFDPTDIAGTIDNFSEIFYLYPVNTPWSPTTAVTYGQLLLTAAGNVYQVKFPGTTGISEPTTTAPGAHMDGSAIIYYYCQSSYLGMFRYAPNNGVEYYFVNIGLAPVCHKTLLTGSPLGEPAGTTMASMVKSHLLGIFKHLIGNRVSSGTYVFGQKMIAGGYIWLNTTVAGGTTAASSPFSGSYTPNVSTVVDGTITWQCIYISYASQVWFWMNVDPTYLIYRFPDSHDSYASTLASLLARYIQLTGDFDWMFGSSQQPSGSGTFWTYEQLFEYIMYQNLDIQIANFLTKTFQYDINPSDGSPFNIQFLEDNCESAKGYREAAYVYGVLGNTTAQAAALSNEDYIGYGITQLYDTDYNFFATNLGQSVSAWAEDPETSWYPYFQAQFYPEFCNVRSISNAQFKLVRYNISLRRPNYWQDKALDVFPNNFVGWLAARSWQDTDKAYSFVNKTERYYVSGGSVEQGALTPSGATTITEWGFYLATKDYLIPPFAVMSVENGNLNFSNQNGEITIFQGVASRGIFTLNGATPVSVSDTVITDYSVISMSVKTVGGVQGGYPVVTPTAGVGFNVKGTVGDTSIYNYVVL